jgi:hypothetical protein
MAYYIQSLKRQGLDSSNIESLDNEEALQYAKSMTNMYHNASNEKLMGDIFTSKNTSTMIIRKVLFPYASFLSNVKTRTLTDVKVLYSKQGKGERLDALRGVAASLSELAIYHGIRMTISYGAYLFVSSMLGWSPEDEDPEVLRELRKREKKLGRPMTDNEIEVEKKKIVLDILISREEKNFYSSLVSDFFSPVPAADGVLNSILNEYIVKPIQRSVYDEDYKEALSLENKERKNNMTSEEEADFKREYERNKFFTLWDRVGVDGGMLSIAPDAISNTWKFVRAARTGEVEMPDGKVRYLVGKDKDNAVTLMAFQLTHVLLLGPPDVTRNFANKGWKILEKSSLTPSQKNQWNTADAFVKKMGMDDVEESETVAIRSGGETWWSALNNSRTIPGGENKWHNSAFIISTLSKVSGLSAKEVIDRIPSEMLTADLNDQQKEKLFNLFKDDVKNNETKKVNKKIKDVTDFKEALDKNKEAAVFSKVMK